MRPRIYAVLALSAFALVGCGASEPSAQPAVTVTVPAAPSPSADKEEPTSEAEIEEAYLAEYKQVGGGTDLYDSEELVDIGYEACELIEKGKKVPHDFTGQKQADRRVGIPAGMAAEAVLCPQTSN